MPSWWFAEDPQTIRTAMEIQGRKIHAETAARGGGSASRAPGAGGPIQYSG